MSLAEDGGTLFKVTKETIRKWQIAALISLFISLIIFISRFIVDYGYFGDHALEIIEGVICIIFLVEVFISYHGAENKREYLRKNWFYLITIIPVVGIFRILGLQKIVMIGKEAHLIGKIAISENAAKLMTMFFPRILLTKEVSSMVYHIGRSDFSAIPVRKKIKVNRYLSPTVDKEVAQGITDGVKHYFYMNNMKAKISDKDFFPVFIKQQWTRDGENLDASELAKRLAMLDRWSLIITDEELTVINQPRFGYAHLNADTGTIVCSSSSLQHPDESYARGFVVGFNSIANAKNPCYFRDKLCSHGFIDHNTLDPIALKFKSTRNLLLCEYHKDLNWSAIKP